MDVLISENSLSVLLGPNSMRMQKHWQNNGEYCRNNEYAGRPQTSHFSLNFHAIGKQRRNRAFWRAHNNDNNNDRLTAFDPGQPG